MALGYMHTGPPHSREAAHESQQQPCWGRWRCGGSTGCIPLQTGMVVIRSSIIFLYGEGTAAWLVLVPTGVCCTPWLICIAPFWVVGGPGFVCTAVQQVQVHSGSLGCSACLLLLSLLGSKVVWLNSCIIGAGPELFAHKAWHQALTATLQHTLW